MNGHLGLISLPSTSESPFDCSIYKAKHSLPSCAPFEWQTNYFACLFNYELIPTAIEIMNQHGHFVNSL